MSDIRGNSWTYTTQDFIPMRCDYGSQLEDFPKIWKANSQIKGAATEMTDSGESTRRMRRRLLEAWSVTDEEEGRNFDHGKES